MTDVRQCLLFPLLWLSVLFFSLTLPINNVWVQISPFQVLIASTIYNINTKSFIDFKNLHKLFNFTILDLPFKPWMKWHPNNNHRHELQHQSTQTYISQAKAGTSWIIHHSHEIYIWFISISIIEINFLFTLRKLIRKKKGNFELMIWKPMHNRKLSPTIFPKKTRGSEYLWAKGTWINVVTNHKDCLGDVMNSKVLTECS